MPHPGRLSSYYVPCLPRSNSPIATFRSAAVQSTNQSNRRQLAFRNWPQVHSEGFCGAEAQPNLQGHIEKDLYRDILIFLAPGHFSMINLGVVFDKKVWLQDIWCELYISAFLKLEMINVVNLFWVGKWLKQRWSYPVLGPLIPHLYPCGYIHQDIPAKWATKLSQSNFPGILLALVCETHPICLDYGALVQSSPRERILRNMCLGQDFLSWPLACPGEEIKPQRGQKTHPSGHIRISIVHCPGFI